MESPGIKNFILRRETKRSERLMATASGFQVIGVVDGGPSAKGENVWFQLDLFDGTQRFKAGFFVPREKFAVVIEKLMHFGGLTREEYLKSRACWRGRGTGGRGVRPANPRRDQRRIDCATCGDPGLPNWRSCASDEPAPCRRRHRPPETDRGRTVPSRRTGAA